MAVKKALKILGVIALSAAFLPKGASAAACYKPVEAEAEQGIRIHSELMVIGYGCAHMATANGKNLAVAYSQFTHDHQVVLAKYEEILMNYFQKNGDPNPEASLNTLRTKFGNKISEDQATMRPDVFCKRYAPRILKAETMDDTDLRKWAATIYPSHPVSRPLCGNSGKS